MLNQNSDRCRHRPQFPAQVIFAHWADAALPQSAGGLVTPMAASCCTKKEIKMLTFSIELQRKFWEEKTAEFEGMNFVANIKEVKNPETFVVVFEAAEQSVQLTALRRWLGWVFVAGFIIGALFAVVIIGGN